MKKIHKHLKSEADFVPRPFALRDHEHTEYFPITKIGQLVTVESNVLFNGQVFGLDLGAAVLPDITAGEVLSALRIISAADDGLGYYSDPAAQDSTRRILGMTTGATTAGSKAKYQRDGTYQDASWNFDVTKDLFLGANGTITQVAPTTGISVVLGHAQKPDTIFLNIDKPITLI